MFRRNSFPLAALIALAFAFFSAESTSAATYTVDTTADNSGLTACTAAANDCSLRGAIIAANSTQNVPDTITLPAGTYAIGGARGDDTAGTGDLDVSCTSSGCTTSAPLTINGAGAGVTVIDAGGSDRVFDLATAQSNITTLNLNNLTMTNGDPGSAAGGGIRVGNSDTVTLTNVVVVNNVAGSGGGASNNGNLSVTNSTISNNGAGGSGGGILNGPPGALNVSNSTLSGNYAGGNGGGALNNSYGASLTNVTITDNSTANDGGGIRNSGLSGVVLNLTNVTIAANSGNNGGGLRNDKIVNAKNTLIVNNGPGANCGGTAAVANNGGNMDSEGSCGFWAANAVLGPLADNGGPTLTRALGVGSQAINTGDNAGCPSTDQRGVARPQGPVCDMGAFEAGAAGPTPTPAPTPTPSPTPAPTPTPSPTPAPTPSPSPSPTPTPAPTSDFDGDGWTAAAETAIGTGPSDPCGGTGWPADLYPGGIQPNTLNIQDLGSFTVPVRRLGTSPGDGAFNVRWDLIPGAAIGDYINITDLAALTVGATGNPPMFGGQRAFGQTCPYPP